MPILHAKNYYIDSEDDIPKEYMEMIQKQLNSEDIEPSEEIIPGKRGSVIPKSEMKALLSDSQKMYFAHGTDLGENVITTILQEGLKAKNPEAVRVYDSHLRGLSSTTVEYGVGEGDLFDQIKDELDNWPHKNSKDILILSAPFEYALPFQATVGGRGADLFEAFYTGNEQEGYKVRPEFIMGIYNANTQTFTHNENFYQNLPENQQEKLFEEVKKRYIKSYAENVSTSPEEAKKKLPVTIPLEGADLEAAMIEWYKVQLERLKKDRAIVADTVVREEETFGDSELWIDLDEMAKSTRIGEFDEVTNSIKADAQLRKEVGKENEGEGWSVDDEW